LAALLPVLIATICLYYLIFGITAMEMGIPEGIIYNIIPAAQKVTLILIIAAPVTILTILFFANKLSHAIVGPFDRIVRELDEHLKGQRKGHIVLRKGDKFVPLVDKINLLLDKTEGKDNKA
jgi:hypothetical protein